MLRRPLEPKQYTSIAFGRRCEQARVRPSTGRTGTCFDNAITESFFASLECELIDRRTFRTRSEAERALFSYIEGFYNPRRRHPPTVTSALPNTSGNTCSRTPKISTMLPRSRKP
ncbi:IS3 family transposase [Nonomuraea sp. H19]|uniref:IS3 family transposase n=1 Tax=Nonomuraea sp. H19 TaxID=3452206 RepID=UPI003F89D4F0